MEVRIFMFSFYTLLSRISCLNPYLSEFDDGTQILRKNIQNQNGLFLAN